MMTTVTIHPQVRGISNGLLGMAFLVATEVMLFAGFISAYIVNRSVAILWPPYGQPRLPIEVTAFNTIFLLASAITLFIFYTKYTQGKIDHSSSRPLVLLIITMVLGCTFVVVQGYEWVKLIGYGLTTTSSIYGAFFYLIIGVHGVHVLVGLILLLNLYYYLRKDPFTPTAFQRIPVFSLYWYFVVGVWPVLYYLVYLM
jgi:cytochrome c oxidase subunit III